MQDGDVVKNLLETKTNQTALVIVKVTSVERSFDIENLLESYISKLQFIIWRKSLDYGDKL